MKGAGRTVLVVDDEPTIADGLRLTLETEGYGVKVAGSVQAALAQPDVKKRLLELNLNAQGSTPAQLGEHLAADVRRWSDVIAKAKIARQ